MKPKLILSGIMGIFFAIATYFVLLFIKIENIILISIISGVSFCALLFIFLVIYGKYIDKRYCKLEQELSSRIFYKSNGNFKFAGNKIKNGNVYFCEDAIVCACLEEKPYLIDEIPVNKIVSLIFDNMHLKISTNDNREYLIMLCDATKIAELLHSKNWIK